METQSVTQVMDALIAELEATPIGPCERVIAEFSGRIQSETGIGHSAEAEPIREKTHAAINELRKSWGPTASPCWVDKLIPNQELDCIFALFHRKVVWDRNGVWGYVRLQELEQGIENGTLRLILGVLRDSGE